MTPSDERRKIIYAELSELPSGVEYSIKRMLKSMPAAYRQAKMDEYDERLGIIAEGRKASDEDILEAWESTLHRDFRPRRKTNE